MARIFLCCALLSACDAAGASELDACAATKPTDELADARREIKALKGQAVQERAREQAEREGLTKELEQLKKELAAYQDGRKRSTGRKKKVEIQRDNDPLGGIR